MPKKCPYCGADYNKVQHCYKCGSSPSRRATQCKFNVAEAELARLKSLIRPMADTIRRYMRVEHFAKSVECGVPPSGYRLAIALNANSITLAELAKEDE